jgi:hypothetical protein
LELDDNGDAQMADVEGDNDNDNDADSEPEIDAGEEEETQDDEVMTAKKVGNDIKDEEEEEEADGEEEEEDRKAKEEDREEEEEADQEKEEDEGEDGEGNVDIDGNKPTRLKCATTQKKALLVFTCPLKRKRVALSKVRTVPGDDDEEDEEEEGTNINMVKRMQQLYYEFVVNDFNPSLPCILTRYGKNVGKAISS